MICRPAPEEYQTPPPRHMKEAVRLFKALGDPTRLRIIKLLENGELCVCQLTAVLKMGQSRISRHLAILKKAGLIADRKQGKWIHYRMCRPDAPRRLSSCLMKLDRDPTIRNDLRKTLGAKQPSGCRNQIQPGNRKRRPSVLSNSCPLPDQFLTS